MRKLIVTEFVSLDGVMQSPGGEPGYAHAGWVGPYFSDELGAYKGAEQLATEILILGRKTYGSFAGAWPERAGDPMADKINSMKKYVVSTTIGDPGWENVEVISENVVDAITALKADGDEPIIIAGSRTLVHSLLEAGLVDQINLQIFPVVLGSGERIYPETTDTIGLELISSQQTPNGVFMNEYAVKNA